MHRHHTSVGVQLQETDLSFMKPTRNELAVHEAGHAYAFAALTRDEPNELGLAVDDAGQHHGWSNRREILHREITLSKVDPECLPGIHWQAAAEIVIAIAGTLADARYRDGSRGAAALFVHMNAATFLMPKACDEDGDFERIRFTLDYIGAADRQATFTRLIDTCDEILAANWRSIRLLAQELRQRGVIGRDALAAWFELHPAKPWRGDLGI